MAMSTQTKLGRLSSLTQNGGTKLCKKLFLKKFAELIPHNEDPELWTTDAFLQMNRHKIDVLNLNRRSQQILFPVEGTHTQLEHWDLTLIISILETACEIKGRLKDRLAQLQKLRNKFAHFGDSEMSDKRYDHYFEKVTLIFEDLLKELNDKEFETNIRCMITKLEKGEMCDKELAKAFQELCKSVKESEEKTCHIVSQEHQETRRQLGEKLEIGNREVKEMLTAVLNKLSIKDVSESMDKMTVPVKIKPVNCDTETDDIVSQELVNIFSEWITKTFDHTEFPEDDQEKKQIIFSLCKDLEEKGYPIARAEKGCVLLHFQFTSISSLLSFYIDYIKGNFETYLDEMKKAVQTDGSFQDSYFEMYLYKDDLYEILQNIGEMIEKEKGASKCVAETSDGKQLCIVPSSMYNHANGCGSPSVLLCVKPSSDFDERDFKHTLQWFSKRLSTLYKTPLQASILEIEDEVHSTSESMDNISNSDTESTTSEWELISDDCGQFNESLHNENQRSIDSWEYIKENNPGILQTQQMETHVIHEREVNNSYSKEECLADKWNQKQSRSPKESCRYDGRLILLSDEERKFIKDACKQENVIGQRHDGSVFKTFSGGFGMHIAIKKVTAVTKEKRNYIKEKFCCSRILHPFILPLLSTFEEQTGSLSAFYFISPFCENGDLHSILENNRKKQKTFGNRLNPVQRLRIVYQTALAIQYLHTPVSNVREIIVHKDIRSQNIVLDTSFNVRLIDFSLSREIHDTTACGSEHPSYVKQWTPKSVVDDYYNFGVVIRELLTGLSAIGEKHVPLRYMSSADITNNLDDIWQTDGDASRRNAYALNIASQNCIDAQEGIFSLKEQVIDLIKDIHVKPVLNESVSNKCSFCMINEDGSVAARTIKHKANCKEQIRLCIACERNSFLNPVTCYSCGTTMDPIIGTGWGALLIAGNDRNDDSAKNFNDDIIRIRNIIVSRAPLVMGIREENVKIVAVNELERNASKKAFVPLVSRAIEEINAMNIHTLIVYFVDHEGKNDDAFLPLASKDDKLTVRRLQDMLSSLLTVRKIIIFLDICNAEKLTFPDKSVLQINACAPVQDKTSSFTHFFIKALQEIPQSKLCEKECTLCKDYMATRKDYITVGRLNDFVVRHLAAKGYPNPRSQLEGNADVKIAYYSDEEICMNFVQEGDRKRNIKEVTLTFCQNIEELKTTLISKIFKREERDVEVCIKNDTYRKENRYETYDTIEKVMMAWILRKSLIVKFEKKNKQIYKA